jgi:class I fructose-bisphosphate aldolase
MGDQVQEILSYYTSDNAGTKTNIARLLRSGKLAGTGKLVILPVDQGFEHGPARSFAPNPPGYNPLYHFQLAIDAGCNAYAAPLGFLEAGASQFAGQIPMTTRIRCPRLPAASRTHSVSVAWPSASRSTPDRLIAT